MLLRGLNRGQAATVQGRGREIHFRVIISRLLLNTPPDLCPKEGLTVMKTIRVRRGVRTQDNQGDERNLPLHHPGSMFPAPSEEEMS